MRLGHIFSGLQQQHGFIKPSTARHRELIQPHRYMEKGFNQHNVKIEEIKACKEPDAFEHTSTVRSNRPIPTGRQASKTG